MWYLAVLHKIWGENQCQDKHNIQDTEVLSRIDLLNGWICGHGRIARKQNYMKEGDKRCDLDLIRLSLSKVY